MTTLTVTKDQMLLAKRTSYANVVDELVRLEEEEPENKTRIERCKKAILKAIGQDAKPSTPDSGLREKEIDLALEEYMYPYVEKFNQGEINGEELKNLWRTKTRELCGGDAARPVDADKSRNMRMFRMEGRHIKFFSKRLGRHVAMISEETQRSLYADDPDRPLIYTANEAEAIVKEVAPLNNIPLEVAIAKVKEAFDGTIEEQK